MSYIDTNVVGDASPYLQIDQVELLVLFNIARRINESTQYAFPSAKRLARECHSSESYVKQCLRKLLRKRILIEVEPYRHNRPRFVTLDLAMLRDLVLSNGGSLSNRGSLDDALEGRSTFIRRVVKQPRIDKTLNRELKENSSPGGESELLTQSDGSEDFDSGGRQFTQKEQFPEDSELTDQNKEKLARVVEQPSPFRHLDWEALEQYDGEDCPF
jgi:hypothetical protein